MDAFEPLLAALFRAHQTPSCFAPPPIVIFHKIDRSGVSVAKSSGAWRERLHKLKLGLPKKKRKLYLLRTNFSSYFTL